MTAPLASRRQSLLHFSQHTSIWILRFVNAHRTQSSKEQCLRRLEKDQSGVLI